MEECGPHEHDVAGEEICATENDHYQPCGRERENVSLLLGGAFHCSREMLGVELRHDDVLTYL